jgi:hypothetical protein
MTGWRRAHWLVGAVTLALFLATGAYMRWLRTPPVAETDDVQRAVYRSRHLFLLLAAVVNLAIAAAPREGAGKVRKTAMLMTLAAPALFLAAFIVEPPRGIQPAIFAGPALYLLFIAAVLFLALGWRSLRRGA